MRYRCPKCGKSFTFKPADGVCPHCDTVLVAESEGSEGDPQPDEGTPKRKL